MHPQILTEEQIKSLMDTLIASRSARDKNLYLNEFELMIQIINASFRITDSMEKVFSGEYEVLDIHPDGTPYFAVKENPYDCSAFREALAIIASHDKVNGTND